MSKTAVLLNDTSFEEQFNQMWQDAGCNGLKGHRSVGGMRASIYNAMPVEGIVALVEFMREFERVNG